MRQLLRLAPSLAPSACQALSTLNGILVVASLHAWLQDSCEVPVTGRGSFHKGLRGAPGSSLRPFPRRGSFKGGARLTGSLFSPQLTTSWECRDRRTLRRRSASWRLCAVARQRWCEGKRRNGGSIRSCCAVKEKGLRSLKPPQGAIPEVVVHDSALAMPPKGRENTKKVLSVM